MYFVLCVFRNFLWYPWLKSSCWLVFKNQKVSSLFPSELQSALGTPFSVLPTYICHCMWQRPQWGPEARGHPWRSVCCPPAGGAAPWPCRDVCPQAEWGAQGWGWWGPAAPHSPPIPTLWHPLPVQLQGHELGGRGLGHKIIFESSLVSVNSHPNHFMVVLEIF